MRKALALALMLLCFLANAQRKPFVPFVQDRGAEEQIRASIKKRYDADIAGLPARNKKPTTEVYRERYGMVVNRLDENGIITDAGPAEYLNAIAGKIYTANPSLPRNDLRVLFDRSYTANASSMGEGTIFFHTGLFHRLQNEAEAAFVLCHELAHYALNHTNDNITSYVNAVHSDEFQKSLKNIKRSGYGQNRQLEDLAKNLAFKNRRHGRAYEEAADSMALELMRNTGYDLGAALSTLALLDSSDGDKYGAAPVEQQFNFAAYPFKKSWLQSDALSFSVTKTVREQREEDSLKTHPDCSARIARLQDKVARYSAAGRGSKFLIDEQKFIALKYAFDYDLIEDCFRAKKISRALYFSLQLLAKNREDMYLHTMVGKCLNELYAAQKNHTLGTITDLPGKDYTAGYNTVLNLIQNLRLTEIAALSYHILQPWEARFAADREFQQVFSISKKQYIIPQ